LNFVRVHELGKNRNFRDLNIGVSSLYLLAAPSTPDEVREAVVERSERGETLTHAEVKKMIADAADKDDVVHAKAIAGHGNWLPWLEREFGWSESSATKFMQAHQLALKSVKFTDLDLNVSSLYLLAAPSTPDEVREAVAREPGGRGGGSMDGRRGIKKTGNGETAHAG
jgi:hypothetical protein